MSLRGKFVTATKAKGTANIKSCDLTVKFTAKYQSPR